MKTKTSNEIKVELKAIKFHQDMSEETNCFSANIYLNGKKIGSVKNQGHGGCNFYEIPDRESEKILDDWADSQELTYELGGETHEVVTEKLDWVIDELFDKAMEIKDLKRMCRGGKTAIQLEGDDKNSWMIYNLPYSQLMKDWLIKKHPTITRIANEEI
jgi:hypothetical protein|tara:strand:- start:2260 stop:2736 length:477 start_codon:yes stop_codon:yes gene_type:complete